MLRVLFALAMMVLAGPAVADPGGLPQAFTDPGPASSMPAAPAPKANGAETPRSAAPMGDYTKYFAKKDFVTGDRLDMTYYLREPKMTAGSDTAYPLVVVLHDEKGLAPAAQFLLMTEQTTPSFIAVPMISSKKIWSFPSEYPDDPSLQKYVKMPQALPEVADLIDSIRRAYRVDDSRIYVVGCGEGGFGAMGAVYNYPSTFAAAIAINGGWTQKQTGKFAHEKVPLYMLNGADDTVASPAIASYAAFDIQKLGGIVSFLSVPGATHDCANGSFYMAPLWKWMFAQRKK